MGRGTEELFRMTAAQGSLEAALWGCHIPLSGSVHHTHPGYGHEALREVPGRGGAGA